MLLNPYRFATGAGDPYWANVVLLLHMDGTDASTTFTDHSSSAKTVTANGNAQIDTAQSKFGGASGLFDGTDDYLTMADSADWDFGTGDFTVEGWFRFTAHTSIMVFLSNYLNASAGWYFRYRSDTGALNFGNGDVSLISVSWTPSDSVWYHITAARSGTSLRIFVDGTQVGSTATDSTNITGSSTSMYVGTLFSGSPLQDYNGWIDDLRITKGVARYTSNFTAPSAAFPNS
jgi:hypothetical protein